MTDLEALRAIAEAATPGEWVFVPPYYSYRAAVGVVKSGRTITHAHAMSNADAAHIAAFNPAQAIALLDRVELLERLLGEAASQHDECCVNERICNCHDRIAAIRKEAGIE